MNDEDVYLGLGSNLGNRCANLRAGLEGLREGGLRLRAVSSFYLTEPDLRPTSGAEPCAPPVPGAAPEAGTAPEAAATTDLEASAQPPAEPGTAKHPAYVNCVAAFETDLEPGALLDLCRKVETRQGRQRPAHGPAGKPLPRTLDIDVLLIGRQIIRAPGLTVPHPLMMQRRFVLQPLAEIAPSLRHPLTRRTIGEALAQLPESNGVELLEAAPRGVM